MRDLTPQPLRVTCDSCGKCAETWDYQHPDLAVTCECCPVDHDHAGLGCRTVTICGTAYLTVLGVSDLLEAMAEAGMDERSVQPAVLEKAGD